MAGTQAQSIRIALAGNPNSGKTTIFNNITGSKQHVGNYPGVTVEKKEGECHFQGQELLFVDLPGTYSLTARSLDELVARNTIINEEPDVIVNVVDASNLERHLYLAAQLMELGRPMVMALNMVDVAKEMGFTYDIRKLSAMTGATVVSTIGRDNKGTKELLEAVLSVASQSSHTTPPIEYGDILEPRIEALVEEIIKCGSITYPIRWVAVKLLESDPDVIKKIEGLTGTEAVLDKAEALRQELSGLIDLETIFQESRHKFAVKIFNEVMTSETVVTETRSDKIDKILTHRIFGLPIFLGIMWILFNLVFEIGAYPQDWLDEKIGDFGSWVATLLPAGDLQSLIVDGIIGGVGAVLSFLPLIIILFLGISFLEDTGYMARAAFLMDRLMRSFGLHGKSFIPLLLGFGCTVPAVMGARILDNPKDRMVTILVSPFMSCSARLPVYILLIGAFFEESIGGTILFGVYTAGIVLAIIAAKIFRKTLFAGEAEPFVMEMPPYHMPTVKSVFIHMWDRAYMYIKKAGTFILAASILVWFLVSYPQDVTYSQDFDAAREQVTATYEMKNAEVLTSMAITADEEKDTVSQLVESMKATAEEDPEALEEEGVEVPSVFADMQKENGKLFTAAWQVFQNDTAMDEEIAQLDEKESSEKISQSYAARFGHTIEPILTPLGYDWKIGVGLVAAMAAKEVLISTLGTIYAVQADDEDDQPLRDILATEPNFNAAVALSLMTFVLIYPPCLAALAVIKRETSSWKWLAFVFFYGNVLAWVCSFIVYRVSLAFMA